MQTLEKLHDLSRVNAIKSGYEVPTDSQSNQNSLPDLRLADESLYPSKAVLKEQPGRVNIPEEMLPYIAVLHGL